MRDIGILTFHRTTNFGSTLQAYALFKAITDLDDSCEIIDYRCQAIEDREQINVKSTSLKSFLKNIIFVPKIKRKFKNLNLFLQKNTNISVPYSRKNVNECLYKKFIVGSDIVWGRDITNNDYTYFLDFVKNGKKFAFSSSVGDYKERKDDKKISNLLKDFDCIAVRELDSIKWLKSLGVEESQLVCDPTMLIPADDWEKVIVPKSYKQNYVLIYFRDPQGKCFRDAFKYAKKNNCKIYYINYDIPVFHVKNIRPTTLNEFFGLITNAKMIFTSSYHGLLFSLYFHKEVYYYLRAHSTRITSLTKRLGIESYCGNYNDIETYKPINYINVQNSIDIFREESIKILIDMINNE